MGWRWRLAPFWFLWPLLGLCPWWWMGWRGWLAPLLLLLQWRLLLRLHLWGRMGLNLQCWWALWLWGLMLLQLLLAAPSPAAACTPLRHL